MTLEFPISPDLTAPALQEALDALARPSRQVLLRDLDDLRLRVAENIASLALRRTIAAQDIPHELRPAASFAEPDHFDVVIGGRRCIPAVQLVSPGAELPEVVCIPEQPGGAHHRDTDLYLFLILLAGVDRSRVEIDDRLLAGKPVCLLHAMPEDWSRPEQWSGLGELALKADAPEAHRLVLHGQDKQREVLSHSLELPPRQRQTVSAGFFSIGGIRVHTIPSGPVGVSSTARKEVHLISPYQWGNIRVYGEGLRPAGYMPVAEFRQNARLLLSANEPGLHPCWHRRRLLAVPSASPRPLEELFSRARQWGKG